MAGRAGKNEQTKTEKSSMVEQRLNRARRTIIRAAATSLATGFCFRISHALADEKMTQGEAAYQATPNGIYSCGQCTLFVAPASCKVVEGEISRDGWCKAFVLAD